MEFCCGNRSQFLRITLATGVSWLWWNFIGFGIAMLFAGVSGLVKGVLTDSRFPQEPLASRMRPLLLGAFVAILVVCIAIDLAATD